MRRQPSENGWRSQKVRRPRAVVAPYVDQLCGVLEICNPGLELHVTGSWRRGADPIGDLDIIIVTESGSLAPDLLDGGVELPDWVSWDRRGSRVANGSIAMADGPLHVDLWGCKPDSRWTFIAFSTGPANLNIYQRRLAKKLGLALSQEALTKRDTDERLPVDSEEAIYEALGMRYLTPEERQRWA